MSERHRELDYGGELDVNQLINDLDHVGLVVLTDVPLDPLHIPINEDRFAKAIREAAAALPAAAPPQRVLGTQPIAAPAAVHSDTCPKCKGTGRFRSYSGRDVGECFQCKGTGRRMPMLEPPHTSSYIKEREPLPPTKPYPNIRAAFDAVERRGLKKARINIGDILIELAPPNTKNPGALYVKHLGEYVGKIGRDKPLVFSYKVKSPNTVLRLLDAIEVDPIAAITAQAATDAQRVAEAVAAGLEPVVPCCCCGILLTDPVSRERGIGPICGSRWGLAGFKVFAEALDLDDL